MNWNNRKTRKKKNIPKNKTVNQRGGGAERGVEPAEMKKEGDVMNGGGIFSSFKLPFFNNKSNENSKIIKDILKIVLTNLLIKEKGNSFIVTEIVEKIIKNIENVQVKSDQFGGWSFLFGFKEQNDITTITETFYEKEYKNGIDPDTGKIKKIPKLEVKNVSAIRTKNPFNFGIIEDLFKQITQGSDKNLFPKKLEYKVKIKRNPIFPDVKEIIESNK